MDNFGGKLAVITGGGTGMGRALALQLVAEGCDVAMCDVSEENMDKSKALCDASARSGVRVTTHFADVSVEADLVRFRSEVMRKHETDYVNLVFNV